MAFDKVKTIRAAEKYLAQGKIPAAIQEYQRIVESEADDFSALNTLGDLYARVDKKQEAIACYRRVAEHYREQGFTLKAIAMFKKLTRFVPEDHQTALSLATLYEQQGLMVEARTQYLVAADAYARAGNTQQALEVLRRIADLDPSNTLIRLRLAESYVAEKLPDLAAEAYTHAGERLAARKEFEQALDAFVKALALRPASHAALAGMLTAHIALGTADEAAEVLAQAIQERPGDLELHAMLVRAYIEAEDAVQAERATHALVGRDSSNFTLYFDVIRLHLRQDHSDGAVRLLGLVLEPAISGRQEATLTELLQEVLARNPEQMDAHRLLVRAYTGLHDEAHLRPALERMAEAAEATGDAEEERRALSRLVRLAPDDASFQTRLEELGGPHPEEEAEYAAAEVPTFESFMLNDDAAHAPAVESAPERAPESSTPAEFEWNTIDTPAHDAATAASSFADLNDLTDAAPASPAPGFQEFDFGSHMGETGGAQSQAGGTGAAERMLAQELESVDFYIEQGYTDIARDTLDMLEGQYGQHPDIAARRGRLLSAGASASAAAAASAPEVAPEEAPAEDFFMGDMLVESPQIVADEPQPVAATERPAGGGLDSGLAAVFDEFREAVEDSAGDDEADFDTHYQMGIAYREMGLLDQAVEEFQTAIGMIAQGDGTPRYLQCCNMLGHCFIEKDMPRPAATWFKKGLAAPGHTEDEYQAMRYDLGTAYERMGDTERAIEVLSEVYAIDVSYRGVAERLRELQEQKG